MERLKAMKESLISCVQSQISGNLHEVDAKELGEAVDMIKDLEEAMYYCSIVKAMEKSEKEEEYAKKYENRQYYPTHYMPRTYTEPYWIHYQEQYPPEYRDSYMRDMDKDKGRMYYDGRPDHMNPSTYMSDRSVSYPKEMRDYREGRSPLSRKSYMESKELHKDKNHQMKELEKYIQELAQDLTEMIEEATPEEKTMLQQKLTILANKIK